MTVKPPLLVAGVDSSTQNCKLVVVEAASGVVVRSTSVPHPDGTEVDPQLWWDAFHATGAHDLRGVAALSITAQQHTTLFLGGDGEPVRDAILWNDGRAAKAGNDLCREGGGAERWAHRIGLVPAAAHPISKLRWLRDSEPEAADRVRRVMLPHDWLTWGLLGRASEPTTDYSDASVTGYWSLPDAAYRPELIELALGRQASAPRALGPSDRAGVTDRGMVVGAGCGDNAAAALGLGAATGEAVVSIGTSMTVSIRREGGVADATGFVDDMHDAQGLHLPMVATLNGARTFIAAARLLRTGLDDLAGLAAAAPADAGGLTFLPYLDGERNPLMPHSTGALLGLTRNNMTPENVARAAVLGVACAVARATDGLERAGVRIGSLVAVGGAARLDSLCQAMADLTGKRVERPEQREYAALGAARQAAWALTGELPEWVPPARNVFEPNCGAAWPAAVRSRHDEATGTLFGA
ncbi:FGGY family carbohydrate kinase [Sinomonas sp. ASV322]|uniref:xylulokinase n=1 Tax=Sinomonas sp. ASV322 TaxID=3041920 RepID=UPI0027DC56F8|nr:FGGY family carbohydrate kinase [Sinomonas sp. ASV322]MDQ4504019.1 FGGY family carbohydrate kinase [Sinomonas sp. ASV322]